MPDGTSVHPRLRGELFPDGLINDPLIGSSPLTRGTPVRFKPSFSLIRFIPAYAGNSRETVSRSKSKSVHPRLRGELNLRSDNVSEAGGSSPLTRGTRDSGRVCYLIARFIPAYAGNSILELHSSLCYPAHPRLRGELMLGN